MDEITILIIEDDEDIRESVKILLENEGFHVIEADNGLIDEVVSRSKSAE